MHKTLPWMEPRVATTIIQSIQHSAFMEGLRERRPRSSSKPYSMPKVKSVVRQLDFFPKVDDDYVVKTKTGGYCNCERFRQSWRRQRAHAGRPADSSAVRVLGVLQSEPHGSDHCSEFDRRHAVYQLQHYAVQYNMWKSSHQMVVISRSRV